MRGLVLEGGGLRGLFTAGVMDAWMAAGVAFDAIVGVSAGAAFGCNYKSHQPGRALRYNVRFAHDPRYCSFSSWLRTGDLFGGEFCYHALPNELDPFDRAAYDADPTAFHVVATDCDTGAAAYHRCDVAGPETYEWMRASASMPFCSRPVAIAGRRYLDGGLADSVPLAYCQLLGHDRCVVVLTRPRGYRKKDSALSALCRPLLWRLPAIYRALRARAALYNAQLDLVAAEEAKGAALAICPPEDLPIGRLSHDPEAMRRAHAIGLRTGEQALPRLREFLARSGAASPHAASAAAPTS